MLLVGLIGGGIWLLGAVMGVARRRRAVLLGLLLGVVLLIQLTLPAGNALRVATGGSAAPWLLLLGLGGLAALYAALLGVLRGRVRQENKPPQEPQTQPGRFAPGEIERYARHIVLREIGGGGQKALKNARVLVIGAGGLGAPALLYLAAAGVGRIGVVDDDVVEGANLQRQVIHTDARIGMPKVFSAQIAMQAINPWADIRPYNRRFVKADAALFEDYDLVLEGSDNFETRYLVNRTAARLGVPLVSGALSQWEGQVALFDPARGGPCYQCVFPEAPAPHLAPSCAEAGVLSPLPGIIGSMMAAEAIKRITGAGADLTGRMMIHDALYAEARVITLKRRADCPVCGGHAAP
ncbi:HesA/MoeB/ThiF family protein [Profundibacterium mesophilum]|uniref:Molybdopterin-synthase adenylyltransferase n=1 Tax=Profundibacterium mesophilum KAUST100406-0324 TaxID=1037889 RepID=A0A921NTP1_9RHOB|nr:molybdopterin-synthase adenylyltransferase MoeB [Profundibacterium mesophilum]KAF0675348.1 putative molybdopterin biosynthesis protein [Profundibacterium mesophilum KAUST100406-0324]